MQIPMQVTFEGSEPWQAARSLIDREVERLEKHNCHILDAASLLSHLGVLALAVWLFPDMQ